MHVLTIIGNRPQFVKLAAVSSALRERNRETLVHTGQHHDRELSGAFFEELPLPTPDFSLDVSGGSNSDQTARMLALLGPLIPEVQPDAVMVYGDTNSTLAGALVAAQSNLPIVHVEAGLRSFDRSMPEEINRVVCDVLASLLLAPSEAAAENLAREGVSGEVAVTGDVMGDLVLGHLPNLDSRAAAAAHGLVDGEFYLLTAHRPANVDDPEQLRRLLSVVESLDLPVLFPIHPRTRQRLDDAGLLKRLEQLAGVVVTPPLPYTQTLGLAAAARAVLTDSGGLQKEAIWAGTPCITLRETTEWTETLDGGWNALTGLDQARVAKALEDAPTGEHPPKLYAAGSAGNAVVAALEDWHSRHGGSARAGVESAL